MPLTKYQEKLARALSVNRSGESHLAGGAAIHLASDSLRYSNDLDYFNDSDKIVADAFAEDQLLLVKLGYKIEVEIRQPGYIRCQIILKKESTKVEWAADSAWRFLPPIKNETCGYMLHPVDLAVNKVLTLASRNEPRDFIDTLYMHATTLSLGALVWAAVAKDPGFNPRSLLELLRRRGKFRPEDFSKLHLRKKIDLESQKKDWLSAMREAEAFIEERPADELGCLYYSPKIKEFIAPTLGQKKGKDYQLHFGRPGGVLPAVLDC